MRDLIIIGSGPAGYTAGIYAARANLRPLIIASSIEPGGELTKTTEVENFPGFPDGIQGPELMEAMLAQAEKFGAEILYDDAITADLTGDIKAITVGGGETHSARAVIIATGSAYRKLGLPSEEKLSGYGVSWCATCDGFFFRDRTVAVIGGGDSAMEEALFLTKFARQVILIHRSPTFRASQVMQDRVRANNKIEIRTNTAVTELADHSGHLGGAELIDTATGQRSTLALDGMFIAIGADPRTHIVHGQVHLTTDGNIAVDGRSSRTNLPGVFAAGDVVDPTYKQAITAAASGAAAAIDVEHYLAGLSG